MAVVGRLVGAIPSRAEEVNAAPAAFAAVLASLARSETELGALALEVRRASATRRVRVARTSTRAALAEAGQRNVGLVAVRERPAAPVRVVGPAQAVRQAPGQTTAVVVALLKLKALSIEATVGGAARTGASGPAGVP